MLHKPAKHCSPVFWINYYRHCSQAVQASVCQSKETTVPAVQRPPEQLWPVHDGQSGWQSLCPLAPALPILLSNRALNLFWISCNFWPVKFHWKSGELPEVLLRGEDSALIHISGWNSAEMTGVLAATLDYEEKAFFLNQGRDLEKAWVPCGCSSTSVLDILSLGWLTWGNENFPIRCHLLFFQVFGTHSQTQPEVIYQIISYQ